MAALLGLCHKLRCMPTARLTCWRSFSTTNSRQKMADKMIIGNREIVGFGTNGQANYFDTPHFPYPAIRYREINPQFRALREKEKGDWKLLTIQEKKCLYRVNFCQTFAEFLAPTGEWKVIIAGVLFLMTVSVWWNIYCLWMGDRPRPESFSHESQLAQLKRILAMKVNPITGLASYWDYENKKWKKHWWWVQIK